MKFKVGDLIRDKEHPEDGTAIIVEIRKGRLQPYRLYCTINSRLDWFPAHYVEKSCEVINESG